jgi:hypothetical protein
VLPPVPGCLTFTFHLEPVPGQTSEMECYDYVVPPFAGQPMRMPSSGPTGPAAAAAFPSVCTKRSTPGRGQARMSMTHLSRRLTDLPAAIAFPW